MKKLLFIPLLFVTFLLSAAPIGEKRARELATQFFAENTTTRASSVKLSLEWAGDKVENVTTRGAVGDVDEALMYIYNRTDAKGYVVIAGDDSVQPLLAYAHDSSIDMSDMPDAARWLLACWCEQIAASRAMKIEPTRASPSLSAGKEVLLYETAKWNQGEPYNRLSPHFVKGKAPSGCVATAICIVMYYHKWPDCGVGTTPGYTITHYEPQQMVIPENKLGRAYKWNRMLMEYNKGEYSIYEGDAVAELMYDVGTAMSMGWAPGGSGAVTSACPDRLSKYFKYSKGAMWYGNSGRTEEEWYSMLKENLHEYGPMVGAGGGHAYVVDGYTDNDFFHLNYGWGGSSDGYYHLPDNDFCRSMGAAFYMVPDKDGTSLPRDNFGMSALGINKTHSVTGEKHWLCTVFGLESNTKDIKPHEEIDLRRSYYRNTTNGTFTGYFNLVLCDREGNVIETIDENYYPQLPKDERVDPLTKSKITINSEFKEGYRLRYYYKGQNPDSWQWFREGGGNGCDEIVVCASPEEIAERTEFFYDKEEKYIRFWSLIPLTYEVKDDEGKVMVSGSAYGGRHYNGEYKETDTGFEYVKTGIKIDLSSYQKGEYTISLSCGGGRPYNLTIVL